MNSDGIRRVGGSGGGVIHHEPVNETSGVSDSIGGESDGWGMDEQMN